MKYAKIICGTLQVPLNYPCLIDTESGVIKNPTHEQYLQEGYLPLVETEPIKQEGKVAIAMYRYGEDNADIIQYWIYEDELVELSYYEQESD